MREYTNKEESRINLDNEADFKKIYLDADPQNEVI